MFGISLSEVAMIALVALIVVGPHKLPQMLRTLGQWIRRLRQMTTEVRAQTGIDEILRQEGIDGGINELRSLIRGDILPLARARHEAPTHDDPYQEALELDRTREYPPEGPDAHGALPDDLVDEPAVPAVPAELAVTAAEDPVAQTATADDPPAPAAAPPEETDRSA